MKNYYTSLIISLTIIISTIIITNAFKNRNNNNDTISVTGLGSKDFVSDLIVWNSTFSKKSFNLKEAYYELENDRKAIQNYLIKKGVKETEIIFSAVSINKEFTTVTDQYYNTRSETFNGYNLPKAYRLKVKKLRKSKTFGEKLPN